jgi:hypothetical protein
MTVIEESQAATLFGIGGEWAGGCPHWWPDSPVVEAGLPSHYNLALTAAILRRIGVFSGDTITPRFSDVMRATFDGLKNAEGEENHSAARLAAALIGKHSIIAGSQATTDAHAQYLASRLLQLKHWSRSIIYPDAAHSLTRPFFGEPTGRAHVIVDLSSEFDDVRVTNAKYSAFEREENAHDSPITILPPGNGRLEQAMALAYAIDIALSFIKLLASSGHDTVSTGRRF